jgi:hypothetical protein
MTTIVEISSELKMSRVMCDVLAQDVAEEDLLSPWFAEAATRMAYIFIFDWFYPRIEVTPFLEQQYQEWCRERDVALAELGIGNPFAVVEN